MDGVLHVAPAWERRGQNNVRLTWINFWQMTYFIVACGFEPMLVHCSQVLRQGSRADGVLHVVWAWKRRGAHLKGWPEWWRRRWLRAEVPAAAVWGTVNQTHVARKRWFEMNVSVKTIDAARSIFIKYLPCWLWILDSHRHEHYVLWEVSLCRLPWNLEIFEETVVVSTMLSYVAS